MTFKHGKNTELWLEGKDISAFFRNLDFAADADTAETTTFTKTWKTHLPGAAGATLELEGLYDPTFEDVSDLIGATAGAVLTTGPAGLAAVGDLARLVSIYSTAYAESSPVGDVVIFNWSVLADGVVGFGVVLAPLAARTVTADGTTHIGPVGGSANGAVAHLHVTAASATDTLDVEIEHSTNGADWTLLASFAQVTAAGVQRIEIAGAVNRYTRAAWTIAGVDPAFTFGVALART